MTVSYTEEHDLITGTVTVTWAGLSASDDGQPYDARGLFARAHHMLGTFGGATLHWEGSLQQSPTDYGDMYTFSSPLFSAHSMAWVSSWVRPRIEGGNGTTDVTVIMLFRPASELK